MYIKVEREKKDKKNNSHKEKTIFSPKEIKKNEN